MNCKINSLESAKIPYFVQKMTSWSVTIFQVRKYIRLFLCLLTGVGITEIKKICRPDCNLFFYTGLIYPTHFLAHLSRRLMGELIVYQSLRCPSVRPSVRRSSSVVRQSTFSSIFSSETTGPIKLKFHMETP